MPSSEINLAGTVISVRPVLPAKDWEFCKQFYIDFGFTPHQLRLDLLEMHMDGFSFILQAYYIKAWAENTVLHLRVSDVEMWWNRIVQMDLARRYGAKVQEPQQEDWGLVMGIVDPSGVLWRIAQAQP